ncbi:MAG: amidohydrolase family protein [Aldersonia sp.]|nr:amidohydrolase family protein [Aldersonia sp.]
MPESIVDCVDDLTLVDHHVHGAFGVDGPESRFQNALNEANSEALHDPATAYDSQLGFAVRRWCAPLLGLPEHVAPEEYWRRRNELGETEVARRMLRAAGVDRWLIDTGFRADKLLDLGGMADAAGTAALEVVRLEAEAEGLVGRLDDPADYPEAFRAQLTRRTRDAVGTKSVLAYRTGFDIDLSRPSDTDVVAAVQRWMSDGGGRLSDPLVIAYGIHAAVDIGLPLQLHVGLGDRDLDLRAVNPLHLLDFLRGHEASGVPIMLLHCYPYEREAGYLAQGFEAVFMDVGLGINFLGARSRSLVARGLELAPFGKLLYSSDALGPAELHYLGAALWRRAIGTLFDEWVASGDWCAADARRVATMIARDNARRVYRL